MNVALKASQILDKLEEEGFNEIPTYNVDKESIWHEQYALFVLEFEDMNDYESYNDDNQHFIPAQFDEHRFQNDFIKYLKKEFPNCSINVSYEGKEFEICGPKYKSFFRKYADQIECLS